MLLIPDRALESIATADIIFPKTQLAWDWVAADLPMALLQTHAAFLAASLSGSTCCSLFSWQTLM